MNSKNLASWQTAADKISIEGRAFINNEYVNAGTGETRTCFNPANGKPLAEIANCNADDAERAVRIARKTFESGVWSAMAPNDRKMVMVRWAGLIEQHADELALLETLDVGKPISDTTAVDVPSAVRTIRWSGEAID